MIKQLASATAAFLLATTAHAEVLQFTFVDAINDQTRPTGADLIAVSVVFDNVTGHYTTTIRASEEAPFQGKIGINANLANVDTPAFVSSQAYFFDNLRTIDLPAPTTVVSWSGQRASLIHWKAGDRVVTSSDEFGIATDMPVHAFGSVFTSHLDFPFTSTDDFPSLGVATISAIPEPSQYAFLLFGLVSAAAVSAVRPRKV